MGKRLADARSGESFIASSSLSSASLPEIWIWGILMSWFWFRESLTFILRMGTAGALDYKTDRWIGKGQKESGEKLAKRYKIQMDYYERHCPSLPEDRLRSGSFIPWDFKRQFCCREKGGRCSIDELSSMEHRPPFCEETFFLQKTVSSAVRSLPVSSP